jgi:hypothetical protein
MSWKNGGYKNYQTYLVVLRFDEEINKIVCGYEGEFDSVSTANEIQEMVEESIQGLEGFARDIVEQAIEEIDWIEIAEAYK